MRGFAECLVPKREEALPGEHEVFDTEADGPAAAAGWSVEFGFGESGAKFNQIFLYGCCGAEARVGIENVYIRDHSLVDAQNAGESYHGGVGARGLRLSGGKT